MINFRHECSYCEYLGDFNGIDMYTCQNSLGYSYIARYGNEGREYASMPTNMVLSVIKEQNIDELDVSIRAVIEAHKLHSKELTQKGVKNV
jgi:hypothetical protein